MIHRLLNWTPHLIRITVLGLLSLAWLPIMAHATDQDPKVAWDKIAAGAIVLDVRTPAEFAQGHLANAVNIPFEQVAQEFAKRGIAKDAPVVLYCRSGNRSGKATKALVAAGYTQAYNAGGYQALTEAQKSPAN